MPDPLRSPHPLQLAVVGGGVSGLAAAHRLRQLLPSAELRLYDAADRLGGPLFTLHTHDLVLEQGADSFLVKTPWALDLCIELGLADELIPTSDRHRRALVVRDGKLHPVPAGFVLMRPHSLAAMLRSPLLSARGKLRLLAEPLIGTPADAGLPNYDESVASFATRRLGREVFERLVQPLLAGIYVADANDLSLAATMPEFLDAEREHGSLWRSARAATRLNRTPAVDGSATQTGGARYGSFITLRRGLSSLVDALVASLPAGDIRLASPVKGVSRTTSGRWELQFDNDADSTHVDGVILATPALQTARIVERLDPQLAHMLARIKYAGSVVVTLVYRREQIAHPLDGFGFVCPAIEGRAIVAASFSSVKFPDRGPAELVPVRVFLGGALAPDVISQDDDELMAVARRELETLIGASGAPAEIHVSRWPGSMPQYHVGHVALVSAIEHRAATHRGLELAGNAYRGVGIPQCVHSGRVAAERLAEPWDAVTDAQVPVPPKAAEGCR